MTVKNLWYTCGNLSFDTEWHLFDAKGNLLTRGRWDNIRGEFGENFVDTFHIFQDWIMVSIY